MRLLITSLSFFISLSSLSQESLLLGEIRHDEVQPEKTSKGIQKISIYQFRYKKNNHYKDSTLQGVQDFSEEGLKVKRISFFGKKNQHYINSHYEYNASGSVVKRKEILHADGDLTAQLSTFEYNAAGQLVRQITSLASITYDYFQDGRLKTKTYYYNERGGFGDSEPWIHYFIYNGAQQLIHVDTDTTSDEQTSFYNEKGELIRHDYYPGFAYTTYTYDERGNCTKQVDYEMGKKDWDSTVFEFAYDSKDRLILSSSSNKRGKINRDQKWVYTQDGNVDYIIEYKRNRPKLLYRYYYDYY
ncbi:MAG: hypothetical protein WDZ35_11300 [Crocinitomicaceae bacterium]